MEKKQERTEADEGYGSDFLPGSSKRTSAEDIVHPNASYVDNLVDFKDLYDLMGQLELDCKAPPETARPLLKKCLFAGQSTGSQISKIQKMVSTTMNKYTIVKQKLIKSYEDFAGVTRTKIYQDILSRFVTTRFPDHKKELQTGLETVKMDKSELEIFVLGETSSGKSTFLNVLMGECILPLHALHTTSCFCRLHNSETRSVTYFDECGKKQKILLSEDSDEVFQTLKSIVAKDDKSDNKPLKVVDINWPIPVLHENVVLVDMPGIGERDKLSEKIMQQLPHAAGYIFIVDSSHAGGVQEGGVIQLLKQIKRDADRSKKECNDFSNVIFVCNKWDNIQGSMKEKEEVWKDTIDKLTDHCGKIEPWQVLKFNAKLELKLLELKANPTSAFQTLLENMETLLKTVIDKRIGDSHKLICTFMIGLDNYVGRRIKAFSRSTGGFHERMEASKRILHQAAIKLERDCDELEQLIGTTKQRLIMDLKNYLALVKESEFDLEDIDLSLERFTKIDSKTFNTICSNLACDRVEKAVSKWLKNGTLKCASSSIDERFQKMKLELESVSDLILVQHFHFNILRVMGFRSAGVRIMSIFNTIPYMLLNMICVIAMPIILPILFVGEWLEKKTLMKIYKEAIKQVTSQLMTNIASDIALDQLFNDVFEKPYRSTITKFRKESRCQIEAELLLLDDLTSGFGRRRDSLSKLLRLQCELLLPSQYLRKVNAEYCSPDGVPCDTLLVQKGNFAKTDISHLHLVGSPQHGKQLTLRVIQSGFSTFHIKELFHLRTLKHMNFASLEGIVFCTSLIETGDRCGCSDTVLKLLVGHTVGDLETYAFKHPEVQGCIGESGAESFHLKMANGIINGLTYIHDNRFVHGHLELSAVLLSGNLTPMLCDINILPDIKGRNYTKCIFHVAPEVIKGHDYGPKADMYSYGILLWELWYGRHTQPTKPNEEFTICDGERPHFKGKLPKVHMIELIRSCWDADPKQRPQAIVVAHRLDN